MKLPQRLQKWPKWPKWRRRVAATVLSAGLLVFGLYVMENIRGSVMLRSANAAAQVAGLPESAAGLDVPPVPKDKNLLFAPVFQNRLFRDSKGAIILVDAKITRIPWGDIFPRQVQVRPGSSSIRLVDPNQTEGRRRDLTAVRDAMAALGWTMPETDSPAEAVRAGLDRFQMELAEWAREIRQRPGWSIPAEEGASYLEMGKVLTDVSEIFGLRAISGAAAGRPGAEILQDLESVSLLCGHAWWRSGAVNDFLWEVLQTRRLTDGELAAAGRFLLTEPQTDVLLHTIYGDTLKYCEGFLNIRGSGGGVSDCWPEYQVTPEYWEVIEPAWVRFCRRFESSGSYRILESREIRNLISIKQWLEATSAAWREGTQFPDHPDSDWPWWTRPLLISPYSTYLHSTLGSHLNSCGCMWTDVVGAAVEAQLARAAIGLERCRLKHGAWPPDFAAAADLVPPGFQPAPGGIKPLEYTRLPDGGWKLDIGERSGRIFETWQSAPVE